MDEAPSRNDPRRIARARRQLWLTTFAILGSLAAVLFLVTGDRHGKVELPLVPESTLRIALIGLIAGFVLYAIDRERNLTSLSQQLTHQEIESAKLSTRVETLSELQRERDTNATLLDGSADGIAVVDPELRVLRFNPAMEKLVGVRGSDALMGYAPAVLRFAAASGEPLEGAEHPIAVALATAEPCTLELRLRIADGKERWVGGTFSPIRAGDGPVALVLVTARDITEQKEMETMQRDFVSIVSHELRSPLTAIKGFAKTLLQRDAQLLPKARREYLTTVNEQADRLTRLVEDLLQVSRIDAKRLKIEPQVLDLRMLVSDLVAQFALKWNDRQIVIDGPDEVWVHGDHRKVEEILINLIDNAVKYSPHPAPVTVRFRRVEDMAEVDVEDHGPGISPDDAANLWQKFQRLSTPATRDIGGTGLGLYIVKGLVEAHGGHVWLESVPGQGSVFGFALPASEAGAGASGFTSHSQQGLGA